jgi:hypothetical protein
VPRGKNWAPSSDGSSAAEDNKAPPGREVARAHNVFQPVLDLLFKPLTELLCPMLMPASQDTLVREYCEELEKDRSQLAQQNVALERELEKLKLSAAKRQRGKRSKDSQLDKFVDLRLMARPHCAHPRARDCSHRQPRARADEHAAGQRVRGGDSHQGASSPERALPPLSVRRPPRLPRPPPPRAAH